MSLYGNFTLREWLSLHCCTNDVVDLFRKALKDNDEPMAVLALAELIKRGDTDFVMDAIREATDAGHIKPESHFAIFFTNALTSCGSRELILKRIAENIRRSGGWPKNSAELFMEHKRL